MRKIPVFLAALFLTVVLAGAQPASIPVAPSETDAAYAAGQALHAVTPHSGKPRNQLILYFGGTGSLPKDHPAFRDLAAGLGYDVISLSYSNKVPAMAMANQPDSLAYQHYRQEICFGTPLSAMVEVDSVNAIYDRALHLIRYLARRYPEQNWSQYLADGHELNWNKIILAGHSQGAGHACYLAKFFLAARVLMFAGPNDYSDYFHSPADWLRTTGLTPVDRHFVYLSGKDEVVSFSKQIANVTGIGMPAAGDTVLVDTHRPPYGHSHCLYTIQNPGEVEVYHSTPVKKSEINQAVWKYLLTSPVGKNKK